MYKELRKLISKSKAPRTNRKVACILITQKDEVYEGSNVEGTDILHAEEIVIEQAIKKREKFKIKKIHIMANGIAHNVKRVIPCENCSKILAPYCDEDSKIIFYFFNDSSKRYPLKLKKIIESYGSFNDVPLLSDNNLFDLYFTNYLTPIDKEVLTEFIKIIKLKCSELYITGSASKRGGPKQLLAKKITMIPYWDLDLIAIFPELDKNRINQIVREAILNSFRKVGLDVKDLLEKLVPSYILEEDPNSKDSKDFIFRKIYRTKDMPLEIIFPEYKKNILIPSIIDLSVGRNLKETTTKKYLDKNWLVRLF